MTNDYFLKQVNSVLNDFNVLRSQAKYDDLSDVSHGKVENITTLISRAKATIERIAGYNSEYYKDVIKSIDSSEHYGRKLLLVIGTVRALKSDLENDYLKSLHDIVQSEIFSDYLEMAEYLISEGFKDPSAVIIGSTLEAHLRELCKTNSIEIEITNNKGKLVPKKADVMNSDLAKGGIYSSTYQKQITAWLSLRTTAEIKLMLAGIRQFILTTT